MATISPINIVLGGDSKKVHKNFFGFFLDLPEPSGDLRDCFQSAANIVFSVNLMCIKKERSISQSDYISIARRFRGRSLVQERESVYWEANT